jgi:hypothetical protein
VVEPFPPVVVVVLELVVLLPPQPAIARAPTRKIETVNFCTEYSRTTFIY